MTLTLAVETSARRWGVALADGPTVLAHDTVDRGPLADVGVLAAQVLDRAGVGSGDLRRLAVDVGPGNLTSVRSGLAWVNALAFARDLPVVGLDALGLLTAQVRAGGTASPVLAVRPAGGTAVYARLDAPQRAGVPRHGPAEEVLAALGAGHPRIAVCGNARARPAVLAALAALGAEVDDTGLDAPHVSALVAVLANGDHGPEVAQATPLTEGSAPYAPPPLAGTA